MLSNHQRRMSPAPAAVIILGSLLAAAAGLFFLGVWICRALLMEALVQ